MPETSDAYVGTSPLFARLGCWRLTRHPAVRRAYAWLDARGWYVAQLDLFERSVGSSSSEGLPDPPADVSLAVCTVQEHFPPDLSDAPLAPDDRIVVARLDGTTVGYACCSRRRVYVPELHRRLTPPGLYVWRLYVAPDYRSRGLGSALVARAIRFAGTETDAPTVSALVAPDNLPSQRLFRSLEFVPTARHTGVGLAGRTWHRQRTLRTAP